jgi:glutathione S-transferase
MRNIALKCVRFNKISEMAPMAIKGQLIERVKPTNNTTTTMVLKVVGMRGSTCTQRVLTTLHEKNVTDFEFVDVNLQAGEHKSEEYMKKQPFGQIPYIEDDGFVVFESRAICRYLAKKFESQGTELVPADLKAYGIFEQGAYIETSNFDGPTSGLVFEKFFKSWRGLTTDEERVKTLQEQLAKVLDVYEIILAKQDYIGGNQFTLADIFHLPYGSLAQDKCGFASLFNERPHVKAWWDRIYSRPSWQARTSL